jgi:hypothetical protein
MLFTTSAKSYVQIEKFDNAKELIRIRKLKYDKQYNGQAKDKGTKNYIQNTTKNLATLTQLKQGELGFSGRVSSSFVVLLLLQTGNTS